MTTLAQLREHRVVLLTAVAALVGEYVMLTHGQYFLAVSLGLGVVLLTVAATMKPRPAWPRFTLLSVVGGINALSMYVSPQTILEATVFSLVIASFAAVRIQPRFSLWVCCAQMAAAIVPLYQQRQHAQPLLTVILTGSCAVLALQIYEVAKKFREYRALSIYDELTGLHNMRYFRHKLDLLYRDPHTTTIGLCLIDLDRFKSVNDALGHREGDAVLRQAAKLIQATANPAVVSRYGGEEFVILMSNATLEELTALAERLRSIMETTALCTIPVTLSCGIALSPHKSLDANKLFDAADRALYNAKLTRNCVDVYEPYVYETDVEMAVGEDLF